LTGSATDLKGVAKGETKLLERALDIPSGNRIKLRFTIDGDSAEFAYATAVGARITLLSGADARTRATEYEGLLFTGTVVGLYASDAAS
jgi:xylan 1,4-beta-xylosidase